MCAQQLVREEMQNITERRTSLIDEPMQPIYAHLESTRRTSTLVQPKEDALLTTAHSASPHVHSPTDEPQPANTSPPIDSTRPAVRSAHVIDTPSLAQDLWDNSSLNESTSTGASDVFSTETNADTLLDINDLPMDIESRTQEWIRTLTDTCDAIEIRIIDEDKSEIQSTGSQPSTRSRASTLKDTPKPPDIKPQDKPTEVPQPIDPEIHIMKPKQELIITLGKDQVIQPIGPAGKTSVIHERMWTRYMFWLKSRGKKHNAYTNFAKTPRKREDEKMIQLQGRMYSCYGPFTADINLDGIDMKIPLMITTDDEFGYGITLADDFWQPRKIAAIRGTSSAVPLNTASHTQLLIQGKRYNVLIDTGAGPSCMAKQVFDDIGGDTAQLTPLKGKVTAANNSELQVWGISKPTEFRIEPYALTMCFMIVENLGGDSIILGRDFLKHYDVSVDVARSELLIRNPTREYTVHTVYKIDQTNNILRCKITNDEWINGGDMKSCRYTALPKRQQENSLCNSNWLAYAEPLRSSKCENKGIRIANAITMVTHGTTDIMVMNANAQDHGATHITQKDSIVKLHPVTVAYERRWHDSPSVENTPDTHVVKILDHQQPNETGHSRSVTTSLSLQSDDRSMKSRSEYPADQTDRRPFCSRPEIEHLQDGLTEQQFIDLNNVLDKNKLAFSQTAKDIGHTQLVEHTIDIKDGVKPFKEQLRRIHPSKKRLADEHIRTLLDMGVIREARSPFASAITLVQRANGASRFCVDFRKLNNITVKQSFTLPALEEHIENLAAARYFTSIDLGNACWQIGLNEESIYKTAFNTQDNQYEWTRMPFGLCNSTATFQKLMAKTIGQLTSRYGNLVLCYVDEIIIATDTPERHMYRLDEVLTCLSKAGLKIKAAKCKIMERQVKFLGRVISEYGIQPDVANTEKVSSWKEPRNASELEYFLGFASYYREFIKGYAEVAAPLTKYMTKNREFDWDDEAQQAFEQLKQSLTTAPILGLPNDTGTFVLDTDASRVAISGILHQWQKIQGKDRLVVINYASRGLKGSERKYSAARSEMLAALTFIEHNRKWLQHREFVIRCDNQAFSWLKTYNTKSEHVARWINRLDTFNMVIQHRTRNHHTNADGLSKKTEYYQRVEARPMGDKAVGFQFLSQEAYDALPAIDNPKAPVAVCEITTTRDSESQIPEPHHEEPTDTIPSEEEVTPVVITETISDPNPENHSTADMEYQGTPAQISDIIQQMREAEPKDETPRYHMPHGFDEREQECQQMSHEDLWQPQYQEQIIEAWEFSVNKIRSKLRKRYGSNELAHAQRSDIVLRIFRQLLEQDTVETIKTHPVLEDHHRRWFNDNHRDLKVNECDILVYQTRYHDGAPLAWTIMVPMKYTPEIIRNAHDMSGHHGIKHTKATIRQEFHWPTMEYDIRMHVKECKRCRLGRGELPEAEYKEAPLTSSKINDLIICDFHTFSTNSEGYKGIWIVMDHWSKFIQITPLKECTPETTTKTLLETWIHPFGVPNRIYTDQGKPFEMTLFSELLRLFDISRTFGCDAKTAKARGKYPLESAIMKTLTKCVRLDKDRWHERVSMIAAAHNQMIHPTTKYAPNEIFLCKRTNMPLSWYYPYFCKNQNKNTLPKWIDDKLTTLQMIHREMSRNAQQPIVRLEQTPVRRDGALPNLQIGSMAFIFSHIFKKRRTRNTEPQWNGPVECTGIFDQGILYTFENVVDNKKVHFSLIKPYIHKTGETPLIPLRARIEILGGEKGITIIYPDGTAPAETSCTGDTPSETPIPEASQQGPQADQPVRDAQLADAHAPAAATSQGTTRRRRRNKRHGVDAQSAATGAPHTDIPMVPTDQTHIPFGERRHVAHDGYHLRDRSRLSIRVGDMFVDPPMRYRVRRKDSLYYELSHATTKRSPHARPAIHPPCTTTPLRARYEQNDGKKVPVPTLMDIACRTRDAEREAIAQSQIIEEQPTSLQGNHMGSGHRISLEDITRAPRSQDAPPADRNPGEIHLDHEYAIPFVQQGLQLGSPASVAQSTQTTGPPLVETRHVTSGITHESARGSTPADASHTTIICAINKPVITTVRRDIINTKGHMVIDIAADLETGNGIRKDISRLHGGMDQYFQLRRQPGDIITVPSYQTVDGNYIFYVISRCRTSDPFDLNHYTEGLAKVRDIAKGCGFTDIHTIKAPYYRLDCTGMDVRNALQRTFGNAGIHVRLCLDPFGC